MHGGRSHFVVWHSVSVCVIGFFELTHCRRILSSNRNPETDVRFATRLALVEFLVADAGRSHGGGGRRGRIAGAARCASAVAGAYADRAVGHGADRCGRYARRVRIASRCVLSQRVRRQ
ncbi:hypothetical protein XFF6990_290162 [Xanthomonas citri pv. fuscans]|nr:hypothetical protein XFF6990_290162 [Xanthomonas citri pv. fuscans]